MILFSSVSFSKWRQPEGMWFLDGTRHSCELATIIKAVSALFTIMEEVVLVDEADNELGTGEKISVHREGKLHRAFSVFLFNSEGRLLLQQRAKSKYHCPGLWSNSVCSHPRPGERVEDAAHRRLKEELGFDCDLKEVFSFVYKVKFDNGLWEHEFDHVLVGSYEGMVKPNPEEVAGVKWLTLKELEEDFRSKGEIYTHWLKIAVSKLPKYL